MKRGKRLVAILMGLIIASGLFTVSFADNESTNSLSPKKVVAILYDDSGSMRVDQQGNYKTKWFYANYAFQIFTGLLNQNDELLLTFMSNPNTIIKSNGAGLLKDFSSDRQKTVDAIRKYKGNGDTPYDQIKFVGDQLCAVKDNDPSTQYWYVIIADGRFEKKPGDPSSEVGQTKVDEALAPYAGKQMANGSECHVLFMAIEDVKGEKTKESKEDKEKEPAFPSESEYVQVESCKGKGIVDVMSRMADTITGRYRLDSSEITTDGKTITIDSALPLFNIQVLTQNSNAKVTSAKVTDGDSLACSSISMSTPKGNDKFKKEGDKLYGNLGTITSKGDYIPAGKYTITFDKDVSPDDIVVMYEAALETRISIFRNGKLIEDTSTLRENEKIDIKSELMIIGTDESIDITKLPKGIFEGMSLTIDENGTTVVSETLGEKSSAIEYKDYVIQKGDTLITARTDLKGITPLIDKEAFTALNPVVYGITADDNELIVRRGYIHGKGSVDFTVTGDGVPLSRKEVEALIVKQSISITHDGKKTGIYFRYDVTDDGKLHVYPKASLLDNAFAFPRIPKGEYDVTVSLDENTSATGHFTVKGYPLPGIIISLIILALIALLIYLILKPHFPEGTIHSVMLSYNGIDFNVSSPEDLQLGFFTDFFKVFGSRSASINGMKIYADQPNKIYISSNWLKSYLIENDESSGDDKYWISYFNGPGSGQAIDEAVFDALEDFVELSRSQKSRDSNMHFETSRALLAIDNPGTDYAKVTTFQFRKH